MEECSTVRTWLVTLAAPPAFQLKMPNNASIQAPTYFVLRSLDNNKTINYLFSPATNVIMREYQLQRVIVTGEEILDERWPNTPVIHIDSIQTVP